MVAPPLRCAVLIIPRHRSPTRGIIAVFSGKNLLDFRRTCSLLFPRLRRARKLVRPGLRAGARSQITVMPDNPTDDSESLPASRIIPGPAYLRQYPAHDLVAWQPQGVLDDSLLDEIAEWLCAIEEVSPPLRRFVDLSRLTMVAVRTSHVFEFARKRAEQFAGVTPVKSALFSEDWVGFGIARMYESLMKEAPIDARAFRDRATAAVWLAVPAEILKLEDTPAPPD
jgi:hypothetical protein